MQHLGLLSAIIGVVIGVISSAAFYNKSFGVFTSQLNSIILFVIFVITWAALRKKWLRYWLIGSIAYSIASLITLNFNLKTSQIIYYGFLLITSFFMLMRAKKYPGILEGTYNRGKYPASAASSRNFIIAFIISLPITPFVWYGLVVITGYKGHLANATGDTRQILGLLGAFSFFVTIMLLTFFILYAVIPKVEKFLPGQKSS